MDNYWNHREEINRLFNAPQYRGLKYAVIIILAAIIVAQIAMIIWCDGVTRTVLFIRGCVGLGAIAVVVLMTIWAYKVFAEYFRGRYK